MILAGLAGSREAVAQGSAIAARNKAIVEASFIDWRDGTGSPFQLLTDSATWTIVGRSAAARRYQGRETFLREVIRPFNGRMSLPLKPVIRGLFADGDMVIVLFDARGTARDGQPYSNTYAWFLELQDGRVTNATAFFDSIEFNDLWSRVAAP
jgi:ketosteroid isomerase-like protein